MLKAIKLILCLLLASLLSSCLGGSVAMQIARSVATSVADNAVANAMDVQDGPSNRTKQSITLKETEPDEVWLAMATSGFRTVEENAALGAEPAAEAPAEEAPQILQTNSLVRVQLFNLLIGAEKNAVYEKARLVGALNLPDKREWVRWQVATGMTEKDKKIITFLIPPEFGKLPSGALTVVELASPGDLNIARYAAN
jgi:hypothetical protein